MQYKEGLYPTSHISKSKSSFKPLPSKKPKKFVTKPVPERQKTKQQRFKQNQKPSEDLLMLEEQTELVREVMNRKEEEVEVQQEAEVQKVQKSRLPTKLRIQKMYNVHMRTVHKCVETKCTKKTH